MSAKQPTPPPDQNYMVSRPTSPPPPKRSDNRMLISQTVAEIHIGVLRQRIEAATRRLESLSGEQIGQAELHAVIEILEGKQ